MSGKEKTILNGLKACLVVLSCLTLLSITEVVLRSIGYEKHKSPFFLTFNSEQYTEGFKYHQLDKAKIFSIKKSVAYSYDAYPSSDEYGFHYHHHENATPAKYTIVTIGDSFTFGAGVGEDNTYPAKLERLLNESSISAIVYNAGIPAYGPDQEYVYAKEILNSHKVDMLIWNFNLNDVGDADDGCLITKVGNRYIQLPGWLNILYLQGLAYRTLPPWFINLNIVNLVMFAPNHLFRRDEATLGCTGVLSEEQIYAKISYLIREVIELARRSQIRVVVVLAPHQGYFDPEVAKQDASFAHDYGKLRQVLQQSSAIFIDTNQAIAERHYKALAQFREDSETTSPPAQGEIAGVQADDPARQLFLLNDGSPYGWAHLNELGNQFFAETVYAYISEMLK